MPKVRVILGPILFAVVLLIVAGAPVQAEKRGHC
jgi:hypothetical protein